MSNKFFSFATAIMVMAVVIIMILVFLGIGILVLSHVCIVARAFGRGFGHNNTIQRARDGATSMSVDDVEKLPQFDFIAKEKGESSPVDCAVCLENFKVGDKCRLLPVCKHSFHAQCVDSWLLKTPICPICRTSADYRNSKESVHFSVGGIELRQSQRIDSIYRRDTGSSNLRDTEDDRRDGQTALVERDNQPAQVGNRSTLHVSAEEDPA